MKLITARKICVYLETVHTTAGNPSAHIMSFVLYVYTIHSYNNNSGDITVLVITCWLSGRHSQVSRTVSGSKNYDYVVPAVTRICIIDILYFEKFNLIQVNKILSVMVLTQIFNCEVWSRIALVF